MSTYSHFLRPFEQMKTIPLGGYMPSPRKTRSIGAASFLKASPHLSAASPRLSKWTIEDSGVCLHTKVRKQFLVVIFCMLFLKVFLRRSDRRSDQANSTALQAIRQWALTTIFRVHTCKSKECWQAPLSLKILCKKV